MVRSHARLLLCHRKLALGINILDSREFGNGTASGLIRTRLLIWARVMTSTFNLNYSAGPLYHTNDVKSLRSSSKNRLRSLDCQITQPQRDHIALKESYVGILKCQKWMRSNLKEISSLEYVLFPLPRFYLVIRQLIGIPKVGTAFKEILKLTAECVYCLLIVPVYDKGEFWEGEPRFEAQGTPDLDYWPLAFPLIFLPTNSLLTLNETYLKHIGENDMRTGQLNTNLVSATYYLWLFGYYL